MRIIIIILVLSAYSIFNLTLAFSKENPTQGQGEPETATTQEDETEELLDEFKWLHEADIITIATKHATSISRAPGIGSVITAKQIKQMGLRTLSDILKIVPGFDVQMDRNGEFEFFARGVEDFDSQKVKVLIDGHSVNDPGSGGASWNFHDLVVENIKRVEIIRGPGSALYGQNAFLAIVNVVTKDTEDIDGFQWTGTYGKFDLKNYNMLFGKEIGDLKISGFFDYLQTEGFSENVERDAIFTDPSSMSPGRSQNEKEKTDLNLRLSYKNLEAKAKYMKKRREGYVGFDNALNDDTEWNDTYFFAELIHKLSLADIGFNHAINDDTGKLDMTTKIYYDQNNGDWFVESFPEGYLGFYPLGIKSTTRTNYYTAGFENQFDYNVFEGNNLTFGFQYEWIHQGDIHFSANIHPITSAPLPSETDFTDTLPIFRRVTRQIWALYLQDEWNITKDIDLTVGVRHDHYTRFEGTTNPRFGLIWRFMEDAYMKFLFATAFRAPNFNELFLVNNISVLGNPSLDPEKVNTYEFGLGYNFTEHISGNINYFFNRIRDRIFRDMGTPRQWQNLGGARVMGVEAEIKAEFENDNYAFANYTFQKAEDTRFRNRLGNVPIHKANFGANVGLGEYVNANLHTFLSGPRPRAFGDTRADLPSYALVNLTFIGKNFSDNFEIRGSVHNLFDQGYDDPSSATGVPTDHPQPGTSFFVELRFEF